MTDSERQPRTMNNGVELPALEADPPGALDGVRDTANLPLEDESQRVRDDLKSLTATR